MRKYQLQNLINPNSTVFIFLFLLNLIASVCYTIEFCGLINVIGTICLASLVAWIETLLYVSLKRIKCHKIWLGLLIVLYAFLGGTDIFLLSTFNMLIDAENVAIFTQSNPDETSGFFSIYLPLGKLLLIIVAICLSVGLIGLLSRLLNGKKSGRKITLATTCAGLTFFVALGLYAIVKRDIGHTPFQNIIGRTAFSFKKFGDQTKALVTIRDNNLKASASAPKDDLTLVLVIGESFSLYHSSLYGYSLPTNPLLQQRKDAGQLTVYDNAVTIADHTLRVITSIMSPDSLGHGYSQLPLFPACFKAAGYKTTLLDNQDIVGYGASLLTDKNLSQSMWTTRNSHKYKYDEEMLADNPIDTIGNNLYVFHLMGQHYQYASRYPRQFARFNENSYPTDRFNKKQRSIIANYDNATLYNDYVVDKIIGSFEQQDCLLVYFSDHGEELYEVDDFAGHGKAMSTADLRYQIRVPFIVWVSSKFKEKHPETVDRLSLDTHVPITTDDIAHFFFDVAGIATDCFSPHRSFINSKYPTDKHRVILDNIDYDERVKEYDLH